MNDVTVSGKFWFSLKGPDEFGLASSFSDGQTTMSFLRECLVKALKRVTRGSSRGDVHSCSRRRGSREGAQPPRAPSGEGSGGAAQTLHGAGEELQGLLDGGPLQQAAQQGRCASHFWLSDLLPQTQKNHITLKNLKHVNPKPRRQQQGSAGPAARWRPAAGPAGQRPAAPGGAAGQARQILVYKLRMTDVTVPARWTTLTRVSE